MNLPPIVGRMIGDISDFTDSLRGAGAGAQDMRQRVGGAMTVVGASAAGAGAALTAMAEESQQASAQARIAVENTGASYKEFEGKVDSLGSKMIKLGHDDEAATRAFANLATSMQDPQKALDNMGLAADIAAAKGISLESAADKIGKAYTGNTRVFKEFGITLSASATEQERAAAMAELASRVQGQAAAQADTFGNKVHVAKETLMNFGEELGTKFGPAIMIAGGAIGGIGQIIQSGLIPRMIAATTSAYAWATGMVASAYASIAAAMPVIIAWAPVFLAVAALGVAAYVLYRNWDTVFGFIKDLVSAVAGWISDNIGTIVKVLFWPVTALMLLWDNWQSIWSFIKDSIATAAGWIGDKISDVIGFFTAMPGRILGAIGNIGSLLFDAGKKVIGGFIDGIFSMFGAVKDTLGNLVGKLTSWKGPPARDARLLYGAGQLVMGGFDAGLRSGIPGVKSTLTGATSMIGGMGASPQLSAGAGGGGTVTINLVVNDQVIGQAIAPLVRDELLYTAARLP